MILFSQGIDAALAGLSGLLIGSFLNVVIYRLPKILECQWAADCACAQQTPTQSTASPGAAESTWPAPSPASARPAPAAPLSLLTPRSHCPHCEHTIGWRENIPVLSWIALRGRCSACGQPVSARYPAVELATALLFAGCVWRWPGQWCALAWCVLTAALIVLALIDWDTMILPDGITLPLLWVALLAASMGLIPVTLADAIWGAAAGYLSLWSVGAGFKWVTGKEGMGHGDFKLFAALGAWLGWQALAPMLLIASVLGLVVALALKARKKLRADGYIPFGPFLAGAGLISLFIGPAGLARLAGLQI
ncbi:MAG: A24 family peptidase [Burkholderiaceae bacterium]|jgi:leader peptidase (prepilin peptidase)/N-methyltransferase|nr:A24 family peptidase [Burkholderiaceae bacterium]